MKKALLLLAALSIWLSAGGCGGEEAEEGGPGPGAGPVDISLWHSETAANLDTIEALVNRFNASQDEVRVHPAFQGNDDETMNKLVASLGSGQVPVLAYLAEIHTQILVDSGAVKPVQEFIDAEDYDLSDIEPKAIDYYTIDGQLYSMPFSMAVPLLYYNKVAFRDAGLDPERPPRDLEEVRAASQKLRKRDATGNVVRTGIAIDITGWYMDLTYAEHGDLFVNNDNGRSGRATKVLFDGPTGQAFFRWWHDMIDEGLGINVGRNPSGADALFAVGAGRAAMAFASSAALRSVVNVLEQDLEGIELGITGQPGVPGGTGLPGVYSRALWIMSARPSAEQEAAWKFIKWLLEPEQQAEWFAGSGYLPVRLAAYDLPPSQDVMARYPLFRVPVDLFRRAPSTPASLGPLIGPFMQVREAVARAVEEMVVGGKDPDEALKDAATEANRALEEYNRRVER